MDFMIQLDPVTRTGACAFVSREGRLIPRDEFVRERGQDAWRDLKELEENSYDWPKANELVPKLRQLWSEISKAESALKSGRAISGWTSRDIEARKTSIEPLRILLDEYLTELADGPR